jgi:hypothetical protein
MGREILAAQLSRLEEIGKLTEEQTDWKRYEAGNLTYAFADAIKSALGIFLFQHLSMPGIKNRWTAGISERTRNVFCG